MVKVVNTGYRQWRCQGRQQHGTVDVAPVVDVNGGRGEHPELTLNVLDTNHDGQPDNLEDSGSTSISPVKLADINPSIAGGGLETVGGSPSRWMQNMATSSMAVVSRSGTLVVKRCGGPQGLWCLCPKSAFQRSECRSTSKVDIVDTALVGGQQVTDSGSWSGQVGFGETGQRSGCAHAARCRATNGAISLAGWCRRIDNDGSEQIVALQIKGCRMVSPSRPGREQRWWCLAGPRGHRFLPS